MWSKVTAVLHLTARKSPQLYYCLLILWVTKLVCYSWRGLARTLFLGILFMCTHMVSPRGPHRGLCRDPMPSLLGTPISSYHHQWYVMYCNTWCTTHTAHRVCFFLWTLVILCALHISPWAIEHYIIYNLISIVIELLSLATKKIIILLVEGNTGYVI